MKISRITVEFLVDEGTAVDEFLSRLTSTPARVIEHQPAHAPVVTEAVNIPGPPSEAVEDHPLNSRRRRTATPASPTAGAAEAATAPSEPASSSPDIGSRRRRSSPPAAAPDPMPINDAEMSKAASNTADVLVNLGDDGPGMVMLILEDFGVKSAGDVPQDQRQKFLDECAKEIRLSKEAKEMAP